MKFLILFFLLVTTNVFPMDSSVFSESYPSFDDYQTNCLQGLNTYFTSLFTKSIAIRFSDKSYRLQYQDADGNITTDINIRIERKKSAESLTETVSYLLPEAMKFEYTLKSSGKDLSVTPDMDLMTFNFSQLPKTYDLYIDQFDLRFQKSTSALGLEKSFILIGLMEINVLIETSASETSASRNYVYYYHDIPEAHSILTVRAIKNDGENKTSKFIHIYKGGEIAPALFFQGLAEGAQIFSEFTQISLQIIKAVGFPAIKGIN